MLKIVKDNFSRNRNNVVGSLLFATLFIIGCSFHKETRSDMAFDHGILGEQYWHQSQYVAAVHEFQIASQIDPDFWPYHEKLGMLLEQNGKLSESIAEYRTVIQLDPKALKNPAEKSIWHFRLARALSKAGQAEEAKMEYMNSYRIANQDQMQDKKLAVLAKQALQLSKP